MYIPRERSLEPPEDTRKEICRCSFCGDPILEGDEYFDLRIPTGYEIDRVHVDCMEEWHRFD